MEYFTSKSYKAIYDSIQSENIIQAGHKIIRTMGKNGKDATTILRHKIHLKEL